MELDVELITSHIRGETSLGKILAAALDVDNIDNVFRMAACLGLPTDLQVPVSLVDALLPTCNGPAFLPNAIPWIEEWQAKRRMAYHVLAFDEWCLSGQAMLTDCLSYALESGTLSEEHWYFTDEQLLRHLEQIPATKPAVQRFVTGDFYDTLFLGWYDIGRGNIDLRHPQHRAELAHRFQDRLNIPCSPYVFYDSGAFSKKLLVNLTHSPTETETREIGTKSESTIVALFTPRRIQPTENKRFRDRILEVLTDMGLSSSRLQPIPEKQDIYAISSQRKLSL